MWHVTQEEHRAHGGHMQAQSRLVAVGTQRWAQITGAIVREMFRALWIWREARGLSEKTLWVSTWKQSANSETQKERRESLFLGPTLSGVFKEIQEQDSLRLRDQFAVPLTFGSKKGWDCWSLDCWSSSSIRVTRSSWRKNGWVEVGRKVLSLEGFKKKRKGG